MSQIDILKERIKNTKLRAVLKINIFGLFLLDLILRNIQGIYKK